MSITATILLLPVCVVLHEPLTGYPAKACWDFLALAAVTQVFGYLIVGYALGALRASLIAPTLLAQPVFVALTAIPLLGEPLAAIQCLGGIAVILGILVVARYHQQE